MSSQRVDLDRLSAALEKIKRRLLDERGPDGHWRGELSTSALSTATAAFALTVFDRQVAAVPPGKGSPHEDLIGGGLDWLAQHANSDGGWGDTIRSRSNISTTTLCWAALNAIGEYRQRYEQVIDRATAWLESQVGILDAVNLSEAIVTAYGRDRTFSVPILTMCALAGVPQGDRWGGVLQLPFELAALPPSLFRYLGLPVVSYALPALIAMGYARHSFQPSSNPLLRWARDRVSPRTLKILERIQPANGGFLEAVPLTSFVTMSLAGSGVVDHPVTRKGVDFLIKSVRKDGGWPIDTDLATWLTTLSINALAEEDRDLRCLANEERLAIRDWLLGQQYSKVHLYTNAAPGAWAWTDAPGGVPDADDTAGALLALSRLEADADDGQVTAAAGRGLTWLLDLQNGDGGLPTFCRGWGKLPFDRSGADLTAHTLGAFQVWLDRLGKRDRSLARRLETAIARGVAYLERTQSPHGSWSPLWFGHQDSPDYQNLTYGTARVLDGLRDINAGRVETLRHQGISWLLKAQNSDGGWGGNARIASSVEETALAVDALSPSTPVELPLEVRTALERGVLWLLDAADCGRLERASPIGFYFARLWYFESLYPWVFCVSALARARRAFVGESLPTTS